jgi:acid stress-induced BolA-like protein IbaG/YrbA
LTDLIEEHLSDGQAELEILPNGKVAGHVISSDFDDLSYETRLRNLKQLVDEHLSDDELACVSTLLTFTPEEWRFTVQNES